jgi:hypothetical protein
MRSLGADRLPFHHVVLENSPRSDFYCIPQCRLRFNHCHNVLLLTISQPLVHPLSSPSALLKRMLLCIVQPLLH